MRDLSEWEPLRVMPKRIDAQCYNQARVALKRFGCPLRLALPRHRGLEVILDDEAWVCVDAAREDMPVMAWRDFDTRGRLGLHMPVDCRLMLYHLCAGLVMGTALDALSGVLRERLSPRPE